MKKVSLNEESFFKNAAQEQIKYLRCDISQLENMGRRDERSMRFQRMILRDLAKKLPELRVQHQKTQAAQKKVAETQKEMESLQRSVVRSFQTPQQIEAPMKKLAARLTHESRALSSSSSGFNTIYSSIWRSDDPHMSAFIYRAIEDARKPEELFKEALQDDAHNGFLGYKLYVGQSEFSLQEQVLDRIKAQAKTDLETIESQKNNLSFDTKKMLVQNSEWANSLVESGKGGNYDEAVFMCKLDQKYATGDDLRLNTLQAGALFLGGAGALTKLYTATKVGRLLSPGSLQLLLKGSRVLSVGSLVLSTPLAYEAIQKECFPTKPDAHYSHVQSCDPKKLGVFDEWEKTRMEQDNCALALTMGALTGGAIAIEAAPLVSSQFKLLLKSYRKPVVSPLRTPALTTKVARTPKKESGFILKPHQAQNYDDAHNAIASDLYNGKITSFKRFSENDNQNDIFLVTIEGKDGIREAIFKPREWGDKDGWSRTPMEYVAYYMNKILGMDYIPPTAYRKGLKLELDGKTFTEGAFVLKAPDFTPLSKLSGTKFSASHEEIISDNRVLNVLLQNIDGHSKNLGTGKHWVDGVNRPVFIDWGASLRKGTDVTMSKYPAHGNSDVVKAISPETYKGLLKLKESDFKDLIEAQIMTHEEVKGILTRRDSIIQYFKDMKVAK